MIGGASDQGVQMMANVNPMLLLLLMVVSDLHNNIGNCCKMASLRKSKMHARHILENHRMRCIFEYLRRILDTSKTPCLRKLKMNLRRVALDLAEELDIW